MILDKADAILVLIRESHMERTSKTALKKCQKAMRYLGMGDNEARKILVRLEYIGADGEFYPQFVENKS